MPSNEYIYFNHNDLFTFNEMDEFLDANPLQKAEMLADKIIQKVLISKEQLYLYRDQTKSYDLINTSNMSIVEYLTMVVRKYMVDSYELLLGHQKNLVKKMYHNEVGYKCCLLFHSDFYRDFMLDIYHLISYPDITFDDTPTQTHYRDGYFDEIGKQFMQRDPCVDYITKFINRDYEDNNPFISDDEGEEDDQRSCMQQLITSQFPASEYRRIVALI